ncbi:hypothetical protein OG410_26605 [Streptomyces sp. NBC_00659]|uniref:hypothetical protein n=1 Tax=Streptomyces sp. NBC_00659 TaxID=2903669 RepID=UPI002E308113|nr:hypothetical protein [Streptomyces sp. NBC_00659]
MEQRIGSKSQPLDAAAVNPAYIPGLTSPVPAEPKDAVVETEEAVAEETVSDETVSEDAASDEAPAAETPKESASEEEAASEADPESGAVPDGPVFEASDRRASIRADHSGVRLRLDDQEAEFRWDEIGAVETESPRFGRRFTITVHTPERRWYPIEIEANARARFKEWEEQLDAVLDAYFEDGEPETEPEPETAAEVEAEAEVETAVEAEVEVEAEVTAEAGSRVEDDKAKAKGEKP